MRKTGSSATKKLGLHKATGSEILAELHVTPAEQRRARLAVAAVTRSSRHGKSGSRSLAERGTSK